jgi:hypothetical protein
MGITGRPRAKQNKRRKVGKEKSKAEISAESEIRKPEPR